MLISFTVGNYRSIQEPVTLSMVATPLKGRTPEIDARACFTLPDGRRLLRVATIYGANASGKSNICEAMATFWRLFRPYASPTLDIVEIEPFLLSETKNNETFFEIVTSIDGYDYQYGLLISEEKISEEWLYRKKLKREKLFYRKNQEIVIGKNFKEGLNLKDKVSQKELFLKITKLFNGKISKSLIDKTFNLFSLTSSDDFDRSKEAYTNLTAELMENILFNKLIKQVVQFSDTGISDISTIIDEKIIKIKTSHKINKSISINFDLDKHESQGTQKIFRIFGLIFISIKNGEALIIDELDARLHPNLLRMILEIFLDPTINRLNAQLIFTAHDAMLLDSHLFRRDQIWFTEKTEAGATRLYSLAEFKGVRQDTDLQRLYLSGQVGAVPILSRFLDGIRDAFQEK